MTNPNRVNVNNNLMKVVTREWVKSLFPGYDLSDQQIDGIIQMYKGLIKVLRTVKSDISPEELKVHLKDLTLTIKNTLVSK